MPRTELAEYWKEISEVMKRRVATLTRVITHNSEMGDNDCSWFAKILENSLPFRIRVDTGFVINSKTDSDPTNNPISPQCDILLVDRETNAPFCSEKVFRVFPIEMVLGLIEVTRNLQSTKLAEDLEKVQRLRKLSDQKVYRGRYTYENEANYHSRLKLIKDLPPRCYIVGLASSISKENIQGQVAEIDDRYRPNGILLLDKDILYVRQPQSDLFDTYSSDAFFRFICMVRQHIEFLPVMETNLEFYLPRITDSDLDSPKSEDGEMFTTSFPASGI